MPMPGNQSISPLPQDIILKILHPLPFKFVLECKLVSKQWRNLINKLYPHKSIMTFFIYQNDPYCLLTNPDDDAINVEFPPFPLSRIPIQLDKLNFINHRFLSGSSSRMACLKTASGHFLLYHPFTGASLEVENAPHQHSNYLLGYGFGYDNYANDYNILVVCRQNALNSVFRVYSLRNRGWKSFRGFPYAEYDWKLGRAQACSVNGVLHWVQHKTIDKNAENHVIVTYDLHTRRFAGMSMPGNIHNFGPVFLTDLDGRLCCVCNNKVDDASWVIDVHSLVGESNWSKLFSIDRSMIGDAPLCQLTNTTLYKCRDGRKVILFVWEQPCFGFHWYDIDNGTIISI